jgi:hypothetical protein
MTALLASSAIRSFDTNWFDADDPQGDPTEERDIHFCFFFDPVAAEIRFGIIDEDGSKLRPVDQEQWINGQQWEFVPALLFR